MSEQRMYRGKRVDNGEWVKGWYVHAPQPGHSEHEHCLFDVKKYESGDDSFAFCFRYVIPESVGQSTGRTDTTGKDSYAGDCIKSRHYDGIGVIKWIGNGWAVEVAGDNLKYSLNYEFTICGNATDNPKLLQETGK